MLIDLQNVIPYAIPKKMVEHSQVWAKNFRIETNSKVLVSAKSGTGKSTLLHIIYGLRKDYSGQLLIDEKSVSNQSYEQWENLRQHSISIVFQDLRLFPHLTACQNLELIPEVNPASLSIKEMAGALSVEDCLNQSVDTLSHGQRQRIAIIRALRKPFRLILLDEPFSHLDEENQLHASCLIQQVTKANDAGMIVSSLDLTSVFDFDQEIHL